MYVNEKRHEKVQILAALYCQSKTIFALHLFFETKKSLITDVLCLLQCCLWLPRLQTIVKTFE